MRVFQETQTIHVGINEDGLLLIEQDEGVDCAAVITFDPYLAEIVATAILRAAADYRRGQA